MRVRNTLMFTLALLLAAGILLDPASAQISTAWYAGKFYVPASLSTTGTACESIPAGKCGLGITPGKHPVIIYLHGCGGPTLLTPFMDLGAIVVAPNSFARGVTCSLDDKYMAQFTKARFSELAFAEDKVKSSAWADPNKMVLAGFSHGAVMTAIYPGTEFKGRVIMSWDCASTQDRDLLGIRGTEPVLAILGAADEFFGKSGHNCGEAMEDRSGSTSVVIDGAVHELLEQPKTREAVAGFIPPLLK